MSDFWAARQRNTNDLVRLVAPFILNKKQIAPEQLYGLCKLTWITGGYLSSDARYIRSTKIPALGDIFQEDFSALTLGQVATRVAIILNDKNAIEIVERHTGFVNFYNAYRNSARIWMGKNLRKLIPLFQKAFDLTEDCEGLDLVKRIEGICGIPKANNDDIEMRAEYFLTPAFFALDSRLRFPIINGNQGVKNLLQELGVSKASLNVQYSRMIELYGQGGIMDAADLDQVGQDLPDFISRPGVAPTKELLSEKPTFGNDLPLKDEGDVEVVKSAQTIVGKRLHNALTNKLRVSLSLFSLYEGCDKSIMFDVMVKNYNDDKEDLLIEVKSSIEIAHIRMAVGQLYSYSYRLSPKSDAHLAVLLPEKPALDVVAWLEWLDIGLLWFIGDDLYTSSDWLKNIARYS